MNPLIQQFGKEQRWVLWKLEDRKGKKTKIPYSIFGDMASSTNPDTWSTYDEVKNFGDKIGIIFTPDQKLLGIDIDHCIDDRGNIPEEIQKFIVSADTYCEVSPSKTGLHLFVKLTEPLALVRNKKTPFELYTSGRYFTVTENPFGEVKKVREMTPTAALSLLQTIGYPWSEEKPASSSGQVEMPPVQKEQKVNMSLSDSEVLERMFNAKNGPHAREVYGLKDGKSEHDLALCSHLAFWTAKDASQIERLWLASPLGSRKKTQSRKDYRDRTIATAMRSCREVYEPSPAVKTRKLAEALDLDLLFTFDSEGKKQIVQNTENICRILRRHPDFQGRLRFDAFKSIFEILEKGKWRVFEDNDAVNLQSEIAILFSYFARVGKMMVWDAMVKVAKENTVDLALDYLKSLHWDGTKRLDTWLLSVYGAPDNEYHRSVGSNWLKGLVKRILEPGCKFDYVLVLEGEQGSKKSTSLSVLAGGYHVETTMSTDTKDFFMQFAGNMIIEFSEGETLNRTEVKKMKAIITTQVDKYRPAYGRAVLEFPRRCVFAMTTNDEEYLKDETGNRRWLPVKLMVPQANVEWLQANRDQLFAEARDRILIHGETVYDFPQSVVKAEQDARRMHYEHEDSIISWYAALDDHKKSQGIVVNQIYRDALNGGFNNKMMSKADEMKISDVLKNVLKFRRDRIMIGGHRQYRWFDPAVQFNVAALKPIPDDDY